MKIISIYDDESKNINYILEDNSIQYNLSRIIALCQPGDIDFEREMYVDSIIPDINRVINQIFPTNIISYDQELDEAEAFLMKDDLSGKLLKTIVLSRKKLDEYHVEKLFKIVILPNHIISIVKYPGVSNCDHPDNNKIYTEYTITDLRGNKKFYNITYDKFDYSFPESGMILDCNNPVYHHNMFLIMNDTDKQLATTRQDISFVMDTNDTICKVDISEVKHKVNKIMYCNDTDEESAVKVTSEDILNTNVYDLFGNIHKFQIIKEVLLLNMKRR